MGELVSRAIQKLERGSILAAKRALQTMRQFRGSVEHKEVLFVSGVQRSGTEMIMQILERSFETQVFHESDPRAFRDYQMRDLSVVRPLIESAQASVVVLKSLCEGQCLGELLDEFAPAKALWAVRRYQDMVNSHLKKWSGCPAAIRNIIEDRASEDWRGRGMSDDTLEVVRKHYHPDINDASAVALFWYFRNVLFFEQGFDQDDRVAVVRYETLARNPRQEFERIFDFAGVRFRPHFVRDVHSGSIGKRTAPEIEPGIRDLCDSMIARYDNLARL